MTIPEAVQLVLSAGTLGNQGEVFLLDMGNPRKILDLAHEMARLSGLEPGEDIEIVITGLRPGEKLIEELVAPYEAVSPTKFEKLSMVTPRSLDEGVFLDLVNALIRAAQENNRHAIHSLLLGVGLNNCSGSEKGT